MPYQLAEGFDNTAGYVDMSEIFVDGERLKFVSSLGTFATARENETLDGMLFDDGYDQWEWLIAAMTPDEYAYIQDTFLDGNRSGRVTAQTRNNRGEWVDRNAILTMPRLPSRVGTKYGDVVLIFTQGEEPA